MKYTDTQRLNYLLEDDTRFCCYERSGGGGCDYEDADGQIYSGATQRDAVDAAMRAAGIPANGTRRSEPKPQDAAFVAEGMASALPESNPSTEESNHA